MTRQFHIGAQNDALFIISGERPATTNDYPRHDADRTCIAKVYDEAEARRLVNAANAGLASAPQQAQDIAEASGGAEGGPEEDRIEAAFWRFDARHKGYGEWRQAPMSERDAFKAEMRNALHAEAVRAEMRMVAKGWRKPGPQQAQEPSLPPQGAASHDPQLLKFYAVSDYPSLVAAMLHHIEKLQAKLPKDGQPLLTRVRA